MTDREKMAREIGFAAWLDEQRQNFNEAEIEAERHATMRGENDHWSEVKAALLAYNKGRADMRDEICGKIERVIADGYPLPPTSRDQCEHDKFGWEDCIACYNEALFAELAAFAQFLWGKGDDEKSSY